MLRTTTELIAYLKIAKAERDVEIMLSLINATIKCGNKKDLDAILFQYLNDPFDFHYSYLFPIFKKWGDEKVAAQIFKVVISNNRLLDANNPEVLALLGYLKYTPVKQVLVDYIFESPEESDYYISKYAILGLLHFDCTEYQEKIKTAIENCYEKNLFPEFIPALVSKIENNSTLLQNLYNLGCEFASTDCNAGIVYGFSLCGNAGRKYFRKVLFDPGWETDSTGTGTLHFAYKGLKKLGITFKELYHEIKTPEMKENLQYNFGVFIALLTRRIDDIDTDQLESFADLHTFLFKWKNNDESDNLIDLARLVDRSEDAYHLEKLVELKMNEEAILLNYESLNSSR